MSIPVFALGIVKSRRILAAFLASDLRLWGMGLPTMMSSKLQIEKEVSTVYILGGNKWLRGLDALLDLLPAETNIAL